MTATFHSKNPALQDSILVFNQDCELVSQLPIIGTCIFFITSNPFPLLRGTKNSKCTCGVLGTVGCPIP